MSLSDHFYKLLSNAKRVYEYISIYDLQPLQLHQDIWYPNEVLGL